MQEATTGVEVTDFSKAWVMKGISMFQTLQRKLGTARLKGALMRNKTLCLGLFHFILPQRVLSLSAPV